MPLARLPEGSIVALLHEDCEVELNLFLRLTTSAPAVPAVPAVLFVLGAVRDMTQQELQALQLASTALKLKLVRLRIGATPEFSSKVVRCLAAAHLHDLVLPAVENAINAKKKLRKKQASGKMDFTLLYALDFEASAVDLQSAGRRRLLQLCVCTLWRSKIGDALTEGDVMAGRYLEPHLRLLFPTASPCRWALALWKACRGRTRQRPPNGNFWKPCRRGCSEKRLDHGKSA